MQGAQPVTDRTSRRHARRHVRTAPARSNGFTLIELVAALVIVGALVALAVPAYQSIRWDARKAALDSIRMTMLANMQAARTAYMTQGLGPGSTVQVNGQSIEVYGEGAIANGYAVPAGAPTSRGMYRMLGCGTDVPALGVVVRCASPAGHLALVSNDNIGLWPASTGAMFFSTSWCGVIYAAYFASYPASGDDLGGVDGIGTQRWYFKPSDLSLSSRAGAC
jgi:prepilin-type N-terminal cleavage/methylation domain-containing protein